MIPPNFFVFEMVGSSDCGGYDDFLIQADLSSVCFCYFCFWMLFYYYEN